MGEESNAFTAGKNRTLVGLKFFSGRSEYENLFNNYTGLNTENAYVVSVQHGITEKFDLYLGGNARVQTSTSSIPTEQTTREDRLFFGGRYTLYKGKKWIPAVGVSLGGQFQIYGEDIINSYWDFSFGYLGIHLTSRVSDKLFLTASYSSYSDGLIFQAEYQLLDRLSFRGGYMKEASEYTFYTNIEDWLFLEGSFWLLEDLNFSLSANRNLYDKVVSTRGDDVERSSWVLNAEVNWRIDWAK